LFVVAYNNKIILVVAAFVALQCQFHCKYFSVS